MPLNLLLYLNLSSYNKRNILTDVFGGGYWMNHLFNDKLDANEQIEGLMYDYKKYLKNYLNYVGYCPVYERGEKSKLKYYIFFASRHPDAAILLNDIMFRAYWTHIWNCTFKGTLFEQHEQSINLPCDYYEALKSQIVKNLQETSISRQGLWSRIIDRNFMKFHSSDYKKEINNLVTLKKISFVDIRRTGRLNDDSILKLN